MAKRWVSLVLTCLVFLVGSHTIFANGQSSVELISGPEIGAVNVQYEFVFLVKDKVSIRIDWGDGEVGKWSRFFPSGSKIRAKHTWKEIGNYTIILEIKNKNGDYDE